MQLSIGHARKLDALKICFTSLFFYICFSHGCFFCTSYSFSRHTKNEKVGFGNSAGRVLEASRIVAAWISVGICSGAVETTIEYVRTRVAFGAPLSSNQLIQGKEH
jgi:hypothetical protein